MAPCVSRPERWLGTVEGENHEGQGWKVLLDKILVVPTASAVTSDFFVMTSSTVFESNKLRLLDAEV